MQIQLEPDQVYLLQAVDAGKVHRHRRSYAAPPFIGDDLEDRDRGPLHPPRVRASRRLKTLVRMRLVTLDRTAGPDVGSWQWLPTDAGETVLEHLRAQAETADAEAPA